MLKTEGLTITIAIFTIKLATDLDHQREILKSPLIATNFHLKDRAMDGILMVLTKIENKQSSRLI